MTMWAVRAGKYGEREQYALDNKMVVMGWGRMPDLRTLGSRDSFKKSLIENEPDAPPGKIASHAGQLWAFFHEMKEGDLVVIPLKTRSALAVGQITSDYEFDAAADGEVRHRRKVTWLREDLPRTEIDSDIKHSLGCATTVFSIERNEAEARIRRMLGPLPVRVAVKNIDIAALEKAVVRREFEVEAPINLEEHAHDQIIERIQRKFSGHALARLVDAVLKAEGYTTKLSPEGPDGGVDVLAGSGPMGFGSPQIAVQVKSQQTPVDVKVFRELQGTMQSFKADAGLLVAWAGFKPTVLKEAAAHHFKIRLWDSGALLDRILAVYDKLDDEVKAELPLQRMWRLVPDAE